MRTRFLLFFIVVLVIAVLLSCKKESPETGKLVIRLTDAPANYTALKLDIKKVKIHTNNSHPKADWMELDTRAGVYDVLKLNNGIDALIAEGELPKGPFNDLRIELGTNNTVEVDGKSYPLHVPGGDKPCLDLVISTQIKHGEECNMLIDLDVQKSLYYMDGKYILNPSVRVSIEDECGKIKGKVQPVNTYPVVYAISGWDSISVYPNGDGNFMIRGLKPREYKVVVIPKAPYQSSTVPHVNVTAKQVKDIGIVEVY
jgi:hypothetical protein